MISIIIKTRELEYECKMPCESADIYYSDIRVNNLIKIAKELIEKVVTESNKITTNP